MIRNFIISFFFVVNINAQYSNFYRIEANTNTTLNANVNINSNINKTVTSIDYGALANAYATRERNRLEAMQYQNAQLKNQAIEIANDPFNAFKYSEIVRDFKFDKNSIYKELQIKKGKMNLRVMHPTLFTPITGTEGWLTYENRSSDGINTEVIFWAPTGNLLYGFNSNQDIEKALKYEDLDEGQEYGEPTFSRKSYLHKKEIGLATVWGKKGFKGTLIYENEYEKCITDNYFAFYDGVVYGVKARYKGNSKDISFEQLEGRRYYFSRLIEQYVATQTYNY